MLFTFTVSIGRNIGGTDEALEQSRWNEFINRTTRTVSTWAHAIFFEGTGIGQNPYASPPRTEDAFTIVGDIFTYDILNLSDALVPLARAFGQKSIALTTGETTFVGEES